MSLAQELQRKAIHMASAAVPLSYAFWGSRGVAVLVLAVASAVMLVVESIRHRDNWAGGAFRRYFGAMLRDFEHSHPVAGRPAGFRPRWVGATPYCLASLACIILFPKPVAVLSLLCLAVGDTAASLVGRAWGRTKIGNKSLEGSLAFFISTSLVVVAAHALSPDYPLVAGIAGMFAAALAELLLPRIDDNFSIPLTAGVVMVSLGWIFKTAG